jgi:uncharacterized repeat protein (TIGR01451 family)
VVSITIRASINADVPLDTVLTNTATAAAIGIELTPANNSASASTLVVGNVTAADLAVTKSFTPASPLTVNTAPGNVASGLTYTVTVTNIGPSTARMVVLEDDLRGDVQITGITTTPAPVPPTTGCNAGTPGNAGLPTICNLGDLAAGATATVTITTAVRADTPDGTTIFNDAEVRSDTFDPNNNNNRTSVATVITNNADLSVAKTDTPDPVVSGALLTYSITVGNAGPSRAMNTVLEDFLPQGVTITNISWVVAATPPCVTDDQQGAQHITCNLGNALPPPAGSPVTLTVTVRVGSNVVNGTILHNEARVRSTTPDPNSLNNTSSTTTTVSNAADLSITKIACQTPPAQPALTCSPALTNVVAGTTYEYRITTTNGGPDAAINTTMSDILPAGVVLQGVTTTPAGPTCSNGIPGNPAAPVICNLGTLASGASSTTTITVSIPQNAPNLQALTNSASTRSDTPDPNPANNNTLLVLNTVQNQADLSVTKSSTPASPLTVQAGQLITYTVTATNNGPNTAINTVLRDFLPGEVTILGITAPAGTGCVAGIPGNAAAPTTCNITTTPPGPPGFAAGASVTITITTRVNANVPNGTPISNSADISSDTPDVNLSNNSTNIGITVTNAADLSITMLDCPNPPPASPCADFFPDDTPNPGVGPTVAGSAQAGDFIAYQITVTNGGPNPAQNVVVTDDLPQTMVTLVSYTPSQGNCIPGSPSFEPEKDLVCNLGNMAPGSTATITIVVRVSGTLPEGSLVQNGVTVRSDTFDPNMGNNMDNTVTRVENFRFNFR